VASPFFRRFDLAARGVRFVFPEVQFAHPLDGGRAAAVTRSVSGTAATLGRDAAAYRRLMQPVAAAGEALSDTLLSSLRTPPVVSPGALPGLAVLARCGPRSAASVARRFSSPEARGLLAGAAAHAMMPMDATPTGGVGLMLTGLAHTAGWPVVAGGSAGITNAMAAAVQAAGGGIETGHWVRSLAELPPARAVLLDVAPRSFLAIGGDRLPARYRAELGRFRYGPGVFKADYALSGPVPWVPESCRRAGSLHLGGPFEEIAASEAAVAAGRHPDSPYVLVVQPSVADPSRAPANRHTLWAYCHVPAGSDVDMTARLDAQIERFAPGFRDLVLGRATRTAAREEALNPNYVGGDIAAGMQSLRQILLRPVPRWNPYRTPLRGIYLCSSSTPPLPGVHGRCGELAALTALRDNFGIRHPPDIGPAALPPAAGPPALTRVTDGAP
jgi:phytoene dehydrogenase-like protein